MAYLSAKYVEQFRCIGEACGSACCRGWSVQLTREDRARLERALVEGPAPLRQHIEAIVAAPEAFASKMHPYVIQFNSEGACPFVTDDHRCQVHATLGEAALPNVCAQYPREVEQLGDQKGLWAALSCPEAARLCLLSPGGADLVELPLPVAPHYVNNRIDINDQTPDYYAYLSEIRNYMVELLSLKQYPLRCRLFFVAFFAQRVKSYFFAQSKVVDRQRLKQDMKAVREPGMLHELAVQLDSLNISGAYAIGLVRAVIEARAGLSEYPEPVPTETFAQLCGYIPASVADATLATEPGLQLWLDYSVRRVRWENDFVTLLDQAFENYCKIFWMKEWYVHSNDLMAHATACMLRVAVLRYRLFNHPTLENPAAESPLAPRQALLERALVTVVTEVARAIEHDRSFQLSLNAALAQHGMQDLAHASMLLVL